MNKKQLLQMMFALCAGTLLTTGCSNEEWTSGTESAGKEASVVFSLGLPNGDEVNYTRADDPNAPKQDATEWTLKTLRVYHFSTAEASPTSDAQYKLVAAYDVPVKENAGDLATGVCAKTGDAQYKLQLSLRSKVNSDKHAFAFVANDSCATFDESLAVGVTTLDDLQKCVADKQIENTTADATLFMGNPAGLCMTGVKKVDKLNSGANSITGIELTRIMARMDVQDMVPASRNFKILSVRMKYSGLGAPRGYLFPGQTGNIWKISEDITITENPEYTAKGYLPYGTTGNLDDSWVGQAIVEGRQGSWYKKVIYMYEYPKTINGNPIAAPKVEVTYSLNGWTSNVTVEMRDQNANTFEIKRNYVYTLQVGETSAPGGELVFTFTDQPWTVYQMDADLNEGK